MHYYVSKILFIVKSGCYSILLSKDNHNSWGMCTTSAECKTIITVVLTIMSGMDPHMITRNLGWVFFSVKSWLGCVEVDLF
jgi:hypothetical protein